MDDLGVLISPLQFLRCLSDMPMSGIPAHGRYSNNLLMKWSQHIYVCVCVCLYIYISIYLYSFRSYIKIHIYIVYPNAPCMVYLPIFRLFLGSTYNDQLCFTSPLPTTAMDRAFVSSPWSCRQAPSSPEASPSGEAIASMSRGRGSRQRCVFCILWDIVGNMLWDIVGYCGNYVVGTMLWDIVGYSIHPWNLGYCGRIVTE